MRYVIRFASVICCIIAALKALPAEAKRVALVVGNAEYKIGGLANPVNDASAVAEAFDKRLRFDSVILRKNLGAEAFRSALLEFAREAAGADIGVVYFAGHGTEVGGKNFLIPVDATLARASALALEAIPLETVLEQLDGVRKLRLVILDACRNNLFQLSGARRSMGRGLVRVEPESNTLVAFAAKEGTTADDGKGRHSPYTAALLTHIATPGLEINLLFRRVRTDVLATTGGSQQPAEYHSLGATEIFLVPPLASPAAPAPVVPPAPVPAPRPKPLPVPVTVAPPASDVAKLDADNERRFSLLQDTEAVGRTRTYTGEKTDLDGCARRCRAESFCQAFSFDRHSRFCYLIDHLVSYNKAAWFVSGIVRSPPAPASGHKGPASEPAKKALTPEEYVAKAGGSAQLVPAGELTLDGRKVICGRRPAVLDSKLEDYSAAYPGFLILNPKLLERVPTAVKLWAHAHACGYQFRGPDPTSADCFAAQRGRREGWLTPEGLKEVCAFITPARGDERHLPGPQRCELMRRCYADPTIR
jgi:hypothetical protein